MNFIQFHDVDNRPIYIDVESIWMLWGPDSDFDDAIKNMATGGRTILVYTGSLLELKDHRLLPIAEDFDLAADMIFQAGWTG